MMGNSRQSIRRRILLPLLALGAAIAALTVFAIERTLDRRLHEKLYQRAELLANTVNYAAESVTHRGELQRIVAAIGAETDVTMVVVAGGAPARVVASTRHEWVNQPLSVLPLETVRDELEAVIRTKRPIRERHEATQEISVAAPLLLSQPELVNRSLVNGAVEVHLDTRATCNEIRQAVFQFSAASVGALVFFTLCGYGILNTLVLRRVAAITSSIQRQAEGRTDAWSKLPQEDDEIGRLSRTFREAFTKIRLVERDLLNQKFALDQHAIVAITDPQGTIKYVNERFCTIARYSREELLGQNHRIVKSGLHTPEFYNQLWRTLVAGNVWHEEICNRAKDGSHYWLNSTFVPLRSSDGKLTQFIAISTDITAVKHAQEALRISEDQLKLAISGANDGIWDWNVTTNEVYFSPRWKQILGHEDSDLPNRFETFESLLHPDDRARVFAELDAYMSGNKGEYAVEMRMKHKDGTYRWILTRGAALRDGDGKPIRMAGSHTDIHERKLTDERLRESEAFLDRAGQIAGVGCWQINLATKELKWSAQTCRIHHMPVGSKPTIEDAISFYAPEARTIVANAVYAGFEEGSSWDLELPFINASGRRLWVRIVGEVEFENGTAVRLVGAIQDITDRRRANENLQRSDIAWPAPSRARTSAPGNGMCRPGTRSSTNAGPACWATRSWSLRPSR